MMSSASASVLLTRYLKSEVRSVPVVEAGRAVCAETAAGTKASIRNTTNQWRRLAGTRFIVRSSQQSVDASLARFGLEGLTRERSRMGYAGSRIRAIRENTGYGVVLM